MKLRKLRIVRHLSTIALLGLVFALTNQQDTVNASSQKSDQSLLAAPKVIKPGEAAPKFSLTGLDGKVYEIGSKLDQPVLLNFWASWCQPCQLEAPQLAQLAKRYEGKVQFYGINVTSDDDVEQVRKFKEQYELPFPILLDMKGEVFEEYNGVAFPTNVLIDKNGRINHVYIGMQPMIDLEEQIEQLIDK